MISSRYSIMLGVFAIINGYSIKFPTRKLFRRSGKTIAIKHETIQETTEAQTDYTPDSSHLVPLCGNQTSVNYCTFPPNYPHKHILKAVLRKKDILQPFFEDQSLITETTEPPIEISIPVDAVEESFSYNNAEYSYSYNVQGEQQYDVSESYASPASYVKEDFENVCQMRTNHILPRAAKNTKGEFKFIVNQPDGNSSFIQKVQVGECVNSGKECGNGSVFSYKTECRQEFLEHKLVSVSQDGKQVVVDTFKFPSCCTCHSRLKEEF